MKSPSSTPPGSVRRDFIRIVNCFSTYLCSLKQSKITFPEISEASETIIRGWGKELPPQAAFFFEGPENASVFIIDSGTTFFKGETGELLSRIIAAMGLSAGAVLICNSDAPKVVAEKIRQISPRVIITLGEEAGRVILGSEFSLEKLRGKFHEFEGIRVMPTFHPSLLVEQPQYKREVWEDMKLVMKYAGL
ncbi:MAG: uracil-DNA glycosylase [Desulfobacteraceae bacterium]|nr:uracil-DNA glycosylase [Desulfobacteraceae bacterium]